MSGQPKTVFDDLLLRINSLSRNERANSFLLRSLETQARETLRTDAVGGYSLLGALAAVRGDVAEMRSNHEKAVRLAPYDAQTLENYAISLIKAGELDEARVKAQSAWECQKTNPEFLITSVRMTGTAGLIRQAERQINQALEAQQHDAPNEVTNEARELGFVVSFLDEQGITDDTVSLIARSAYSVAPKASLAGFASRVTADDENKWVDFVLYLTEDAKHVAELNFRLAEAIAELTVDAEEVARAAGALVVRFTSSLSSDVNNTH